MNSDMIVLDEATSALDLINSKNILKILDQNLIITIIISTHRVELLKNAIRLFYLKMVKLIL